MFPETKSNFEKRAGIPATESGHLQLHALITCNIGQHFAGNSELFPAHVATLMAFGGKQFHC